MKNWNWKQWLGFSIIAAYVITLIVLVYTAPTTMFFGLISLAIGVIGTLLIKARKPTNLR